MPNKLLVAVTGGIGSGKSTVLQMFAKLGYPVFSADAIAKNIYDDADVLAMTKKYFSDCILSNKIDRQKLAHCVFTDPQKLQILNSITHPKIMQILKNQMNACDSPLVFAEVPLLFEAGLQTEFDRVVIVLRNMQERIRSAALRDGVSDQDIKMRITNQFDYEKNAISGHTVLYNDKDYNSLFLQVKQVANDFLSQTTNT